MTVQPPARPTPDPATPNKDLEASLRDALAALAVWVETCRDLGRGAIREACQRQGLLNFHDATDIFDRQMDNVLGRIHGLEKAGE